jgi:cytochrome c peroxidase
MKFRTTLVVVILCFFCSSILMAANRYVGATKCKSCHKKEKVGAQYIIWSKGKHVKAFKSLSTQKAVNLAKQLGINTPPQKEKACLICHVKSQYDENGKAHPKTMFFKKYKKTDGVQCEDCHGPGEKYVKKKIMKKIRYKEGGAAKSATAKKTGLWVPDEKTCKQCHVAEIKIGGVVYKNPSFKDFDFAIRIKEVQHPIPKK